MLYTELLILHRGPLSLDPWLYVTPLELAPFAPLLGRLGVRESFDTSQYSSVLAALAIDAGEQPLSETALGQAISIVQVGFDVCKGKPRPVGRACTRDSVISHCCISCPTMIAAAPERIRHIRVGVLADVPGTRLTSYQ